MVGEIEVDNLGGVMNVSTRELCGHIYNSDLYVYSYG